MRERSAGEEGVEWGRGLDRGLDRAWIGSQKSLDKACIGVYTEPR